MNLSYLNRDAVIVYEYEYSLAYESLVDCVKKKAQSQLDGGRLENFRYICKIVMHDVADLR